MTDQLSVLYVCVHNAGRSQMAAAYLQHLAGGRIEVRSAGSAPADTVNPAAVEAMAEEGIDISAETPKVLTTDAVRESDVVITMGCGDACPVFPGVSYRDWALDDPAGQGIDAVRPIRDQIRGLVANLLDELVPADQQVGLRVYGATVFDKDDAGACTDSQLQVPLGTDNQDAMRAAVAEYRPYGETPIGYALQEAGKDLGDSGRRNILLVSDGVPTCQPPPCDRT